MICAYCNQDLVRCTCPDADERLESLRKSPYLDQRWIERVIAERFLDKPRREREQQKAEK